jgi:hypothetical protein
VYKLEDVFGVTSKQVLSYIERANVDDQFREALNSQKQIIVYGSSKQGKTALVSKHLPYAENILVSLTPKTQLVDIYQTVLAKAGVRILSSGVEKSGSENSIGFVARLKALIPVFGGAEAETSGQLKTIQGTEQKYEEVQANIELPQTVADLLNRVGSTRWVILENFHYLTDEVQQQFAFDLRAFQELGVKFVILGVWREKNRMAQFNGDLLDRTIEVPVEPWLDDDFKRVAQIGSGLLNIELSPLLITEIIKASFSSIGVFQELMKHVCIYSKVKENQEVHLQIQGDAALKSAIDIKTQDYASRHQRALEAISAGHPNSGGAKGDLQPLHLPYYLVRTILEHGFDGIAKGASKTVIWDWIRAIHHRSDSVRSGDMTNLLGGIANLQSIKAISPPILAYDAQQKILQVVDSTFYFFIRNADTAEVLESLQNPLET